LNWRMYKYLALGCLTYVPGLHAALRRGTGGTTSARYCYSVWLRHLVLDRSLCGPFTVGSVAELGPGDSLGVGMAALLSGAQRYLALDALPHARTDRNLRVFDELVELFRARAPIPDDNEFPDVNPKLADYSFPDEILTDEVLASALAPPRLEQLRRNVHDLAGSVSYRPTWYREQVAADEAVDLVVSQAVLEHVDALEDTYGAMFRWLRPGGVMSHQIDFKCHATADRWNGHLAYSDLSWQLMRGKLPYFINRRSPTDHFAAATSAGFSSVSLVRVLREDGLPVTQFAPRFRGMSDLDARSAGGFLQAVRPSRAA
jgi:SAM-dependent methyltransferase